MKRLARLADISFADRPPEGAVQLLVRGEVVALPLKGVIWREKGEFSFTACTSICGIDMYGCSLLEIQRNLLG